MPLERILEAYLLTLSVPLKPGSIHRLYPGPEFEIRLVEFISAEEALAMAYERGAKLARGETDVKHLGLGRIIERALLKAYELTETIPLTGMIAALVPLSAALGYYDSSSGINPLDSLRRIVALYMHASPPSDAVRLLSALEAVGDRDLVLFLDREGISRRKIEASSMSIGDIYEILYSVDRGFIIHLRGLSRLVELYHRVKSSGNALEGIMNAYLDILEKEGNTKVPRPLSARSLAKLDREISDRRHNRLLGAVAAAMGLALFEEPPLLPGTTS